MAVRLIESFVASVDRDPDGIAVRDGHDGRCWSRASILAEASRLAARLELEIRSSATVMIHGASGGGFWAGLLAGFAAGRRVLPVGPESTERDLATLAAAHDVGGVIETSKAERWTSPPAPIQVFDVDSAGRGGASSLPARAGSCCLLLRSSGTTSRPAVALRSARALDRVASVLVRCLELHDEDVVHMALPMQHAYGMEHGVLAPMMAGARVQWTRAFDPVGDVAAAFHGVTVLPTVPAILDALGRERISGATLRQVYTAGSPLPRSSAERFASTWGVEPGDLYGMTEVGTIAFGRGGRNSPVDGVDVRILDDDGRLGTTGVGEVVVRSDAMFDGYVQDAGGDVDPGRRVDDFLRTGDLGDVDAAGTVAITGRAKVQFDVGGLKVNPEEIEAVLREHSDVDDVAVAPLQLSETIVRVRAIVVLRDGADSRAAVEDLKRHGRETLPTHQRPRSIEVVAMLPRTATGKLRRGLLDSI